MASAACAEKMLSMISSCSEKPSAFLRQTVMHPSVTPLDLSGTLIKLLIPSGLANSLFTL